MSFFKRTFKKAKKGVNKAVNKIEKVADKGVDKLEKGANLAKEGLEETGDFLLNSSDREYWHKEISHLKNRSNKLREELNNKINTYYDVRIDYQERIHHYITIKQDTIALGLVSSEKLDLDKVTDTAGVIVDVTRDFSESNSEIEEIGRYALGFVSAGISDIVFASQEAKKEAEHLKKQISRLEESLEKINNNIANHKKGIVLINQSLTEILQLYGDDTTIDNFVSKQCKLIYEQAKEVKVQETIIRMQEKGVTQQEIVEATANI
ncbi:hypothetical protein VB735_15630 [Halotia wernerae UHCC 0503]|nr:hypothetical protein [Halotia wernerae UHCC 0503]